MEPALGHVPQRFENAVAAAEEPDRSAEQDRQDAGGEGRPLGGQPDRLEALLQGLQFKIHAQGADEAPLGILERGIGAVEGSPDVGVGLLVDGGLLGSQSLLKRLAGVGVRIHQLRRFIRLAVLVVVVLGTAVGDEVDLAVLEDVGVEITHIRGGLAERLHVGNEGEVGRVLP